jgi:hypothetical protein
MEPNVSGAERIPSARSRQQSRPDRFGLWELMALIAGLAFGLWLVLKDVAGESNGSTERVILVVIAGVLGGLAMVGPPLLLAERRRVRSRWGTGKLLWFSSGTAAWLLWPPVVYRRFKGGEFADTESGICFAYGTPLMALYVTSALVAGGWLGRRRRRHLRRSWREQFGLLLGLAWACTGLYVLYLLYHDDFQK